MQKAKIKKQHDPWGFQYYFKKAVSIPHIRKLCIYLRKKNYKKIMVSCEEFTKTTLYIP